MKVFFFLSIYISEASFPWERSPREVAMAEKSPGCLIQTNLPSMLHPHILLGPPPLLYNGK